LTKNIAAALPDVTTPQSRAASRRTRPQKLLR